MNLKKSFMAALAATVCSSGAMAWNLDISTTPVYAAEQFGGGAVTLVVAGLGDVVLTADGTDVSLGEQAIITYTLPAGFTFAVAPAASLTLTQTDLDELLVTNLRLTGAIGESVATYGLEIGAGTWDGDEVFTLTLPELSGTLSAGQNASIVVTIERQGTPDPFTPFDNVVIVAVADTDVIASAVTAVSAVLVAAAVNDADINISTREAFDAVTTTNIASATIGLLGTVTLIESGAVTGANVAFAVGVTDALALTVTGDFSNIASTCLDVDITDICGDPNDIAGVIQAGNGSAVYAATDGSAFVGVLAQILIIANTVDEISVGDYSANGSLDFVAATASDLTIASVALAATSFSGLTPAGRVLVVTKVSSADNTFIRITNTSGLAVDLFAQMTTQGGTVSSLVEMTDVVANSTVVITSEDIEGMFGTFAGRSNVEFLSSTPLSLEILNLIRTNDVLTNMNP